MRLWIDDIRTPPVGWDIFHKDVWARTVNSAISAIVAQENTGNPFTVIDIDHDAGDYAQYGGDYIKLLDWLEWAGFSYPIHIHSMNPVGVQNMRAIIQHNGWEEV